MRGTGNHFSHPPPASFGDAFELTTFYGNPTVGALIRGIAAKNVWNSAQLPLPIVPCKYDVRHPLKNQSSVFDRRRNEKACHRCLISRARDMPKFSRTFWPFRIHEKVRRIERPARRHFVFCFEFFCG